MKKEKYFDTKEDALQYGQKFPQYNKVPEYISCRQKWAFVFPIKTTLQKEQEQDQKMVTTSIGTYALTNNRGGGKGYEIGKISECCLGYFVQLENDERMYFQKLDDVLAIRKAFKEL